MRRFASAAALVLTMSLGMASGALATNAAPRPAGAPAGANVVVAPATSHVWKATAGTTGFHGSSRLVISATYSGGTAHVIAHGVKKGDRLLATIAFRTAKGKVTRIVSHSMTITVVKSGMASFAFKLTTAEAHAIRAALKAGDSLSFHLRDGSARITAPYVKVA